jgi:lambda family phage portal protein
MVDLVKSQKPVVRWRGGRAFSVENTKYDAGTLGTGRSRNWDATDYGPNAILSSQLETLRNRSRIGTRNNPWIFQAIERLVSNEVGIGVTLSSGCEKESFQKKIDAIWKQHKDLLDYNGLLPFGGLQQQAVRGRRVSGEVFIQRVRVSRDSPLPLPYQIIVHESDMVPIQLTQELANGNVIHQGIEFNRKRRRTAIWFWRSHPKEQALGSGQFTADQFVRVPIRDVIHHFDPTMRPGQIRGEPNSARSLVSAITFDSYEDAELTRKQTRAPFTGVVTRPDYEDSDFLFDPFTGDTLDEQAQGAVPVNATPGTFLSTLPGEGVTLFDGDNTGQGFKDYSRMVLLKIAAGYGIPYEMISGDWSGVNDRLVRAIVNEFRRQIEAAQDHLLIFQLCRGVWRWGVEAAVMTGRVKAADFWNKRDSYLAVIARPHAWEYVNPEQDVNTKIKLLEKRLTSRKAVADSMPGPSIEEIDRQIEQDNEKSVYSASSGNSSGFGKQNPPQPPDESGDENGDDEKEGSNDE